MIFLTCLASNYIEVNVYFQSRQSRTGVRAFFGAQRFNTSILPHTNKELHARSR
jgi:hypothetical protein